MHNANGQPEGDDYDDDEFKLSMLATLDEYTAFFSSTSTALGLSAPPIHHTA